MRASEAQSDFNQTVTRISENIRKEIHNRISLSETMSLYSHLPEGLTNFVLVSPKKVSARQALALALLVDEFHPERGILIKEHLNMLSFLFQYEGLWLKVHKLLKLNRMEHKVYELLENGFSSREIFGNLIDLGLQTAMQFSYQVEKEQKIVYPQRKRGYNDHGSRRDDSKWLPTDIHLGPNPEKKDFRKSVGNKLKGILNFLYG